MWRRAESGRLERSLPVCKVSRDVLGHIAELAGNKTMATADSESLVFVKTRRDGSTQCRLGDRDLVIPKVAAVRVFGITGIICTMQSIAYRVLFGSRGDLGRMRWPMIYCVFHRHAPVSFDKSIRGVYEVHIVAPDETLCEMLLE